MPTIPAEIDSGYQQWKAELIRITAEKTNQSPESIKINDLEAFQWYNDGITPYICFRETWNMENDC